MNPLHFIIFLIFVYILAFVAGKKRRKKQSYNPYKDVGMRSKLVCERCGWTTIVSWRKGDTVYKIVDDERSRHKHKGRKCKGKVEIKGIFYVPKLSKKERKYLEYRRKFN